MRTSIKGLLTALAAGCVAASCITGEPPLEPLLWEAELTTRPGAPPGMRAAAAMAALESWSELGVSVDGGEPGSTLGWTVRTGGCAESGARVGPEAVFPSFQLDVAGHGGTETTLNRRLPAATYSVEVFTLGASGGIIACGVFERTDPGMLGASLLR